MAAILVWQSKDIPRMRAGQAGDGKVNFIAATFQENS
jgi:hypothetical protein